MKKRKDNSNKKAVALIYREEYTAPRVIAKGKGKTADKIVEVGKEKDIEIYEDKNLVEDLLKLELYEEIPPELYEVVSEIILFVYSLDKEKGESYGK